MLDLESFAPWRALGGGALIGLSSALLYVVSGRVAGISGIVGNLLGHQKADLAWRAVFLLGLLVSPLVWSLLSADGLPPFRLQIETPKGWVALIVAGWLVGFGTRLANGCTSGHGVCGLARLSRRSLVAVLAFMASGMGTVYVSCHLMIGA